MAYEVVVTASPDESLASYKDGRCNVLTSDMSQLYSQRDSLPDADEHVILPDAISKEPLGPAVRQDDPELGDAREVGPLRPARRRGARRQLSKTIDEALASKKPDVQRLVGADGTFGEKLGLTNDWAAQMVRQVGNYGEIYERNLGTGSSARHSARHEPALEPRRHPVRAADPVNRERRFPSFPHT